MSDEKKTRAEQLSAVLRDLDALSWEVRQITDRADKISRRLIEVQFAIARFEEGTR